MGVSFVGTALSKLLGAVAPSLPAGVVGFARYLEAAGVPFPLWNALLVCVVELLAGTGVLLSTWLWPLRRLTRVMALPLAIDMAVAVATVGAPTALGRPILIDGAPVTNEPWRLPFELLLLGATTYLVLRPAARPPSP